MNPGISWQGHLGGFIGGVLLAGAFAFSPRERRGTWQLISFVVLMVAVAALIARSEEHTSELQSLMRISYAVFCLKNKNESNQTKSQIRSIHTDIHATTK